MAQTPSSIAPSEDMYLSDIITGAHGDQYQKDLAMVIFERATRKGYDFRLGYEMAIADKFDDVTFFNKRKNEWLLIQTKHAYTSKEKKEKVKPIIFDMLFPTDETGRKKGDFSLFKYLKSYTTVRTNIKQRKSFIIFTNRDLIPKSLGSAVEIEPREVDEILRFENASHVGLKVKHQQIKVMLDFVNLEFNGLRNSIIKLFKEGTVDQTLLDFKTPISRLFARTNTHVKFSETHSLEASQILTSLHGVLDIQTAQLPFDKCKKLFTGMPRKKTLPIFVDEDTAYQFFQDLVLYVRQPDDLHDIIDQDLRCWMRTWIQPSYLQRMDDSQLAMTTVSLEKKFKQKQSQIHKLKDGNYKKFLNQIDGEEFFRCAEQNLKKQIHHPSNCNLRYTNDYYVSRQIEYEEFIEELFNNNDTIEDIVEGSRSNYRAFTRCQMKVDKTFCHRNISQIDSTVKKTIRDDKFVDELSSFFEKHKFLLLTAEPGMGKSTILEYIALSVQQKCNDSVYHFNLNTFNEYLSNHQETDDFDKLLSILSTTMSDSNLKNLRETLNDKGTKKQHLMIFDAFDEVNPQHRKKVFKIFRALLNVPSVAMLVSTRRTLKTFVENEFKVKTLYLRPFSDLDQKHFLKRFWIVSEENENNFSEYVAHLFNFFHKAINRALLEFTGIPLMLKMLAEVYADHFKEYLKTVQNNSQNFMPQEELSIVNLYEQFVKKCFASKLTKKFIILWEESDEDFDPLLEKFILEHQLLAIKHLQIKSLQIVFQKEKHLEKLNEFEKRIVKSAETSPLIESIDNNINFIHLSYAEFLVAKFLSNNINNYETEIFGVDSEADLFEHFPMIRIFFFTMIEVANSTQHLKTLRRHYQQNSNIALWACEVRGKETIEFLLQNIYDSTIIQRLLGVSAQHNCFQICQILLEKYQGKVNCTFKGSNLTDLMENNFMVDNSDFNANGWTPLLIAAVQGHLKVVKILIDHDGDVNAKTNEGSTPVMYAAYNGHLEVLKILIDHAGDVNAKTNIGLTPLQIAATIGHLEVVKILIDHAADVNAKTKVKVNARQTEAWIPLHFAAANGHLEVVKILIDHAGDVNAKTNKGLTPLSIAALAGHLEVVQILINHAGDVNSKINGDLTPLLIAAHNGHLEVVKILIDHAGDVNARDIEKWTPLHFAAKQGYSEVVKILIDHDGDVNAKTNEDSTPLHLAAEQGQLKVVKSLIDHAADVNAREIDECTPLHYAAQQGHLEVVKTLIDHDGDVNAKTNEDSTPLSFAARYGHLEVVKFLIDLGGEVNTKTNEGSTPLSFAAENGHLEVVKILIDHAADVNARKIDEWTPLHFAAKNGQLEVVRILIDHNGEVNAKTNEDSTPLHLAAQQGQLKVVKILIDHAADVNARKIDEWTPLHFAAKNGQLEVVRILIDHNGEVNAKTNEGLTPLSFAAANSHLDVVKILIENGGEVNEKQMKLRRLKKRSLLL